MTTNGTLSGSSTSGTVAGSHAYPEQGVFTVRVCVKDAANRTGCDDVVLTVANGVPRINDDAGVDLRRWKAESYGTGPNWVVSADGKTVTQTINSVPAIFYSDFPAFGSRVEGTIRVLNGSFVDDDFVGFVLGFLPGDTTSSNADYLLIDWKQGNQTEPFDCGNATAVRGLAVSRVKGLPGTGELWAHNDQSCNGSSNSLQELARGLTRGSSGWSFNTDYKFTFELSATRLQVFVNGTLELDVAGDFRNGRLGFYNYSQENVRYSSFTFVAKVDDEGQPVEMVPTFGDPGVQDTHTATLEWGDGVTTPATVEQGTGFGTVRGTHRYGDNGSYTVRTCVTDDEGATGCGSFPVSIRNVAPAVDAGPDLTVPFGAPMTADLATFADPGFLDTHTATIAWGDGTTTAGTVTESGGAGTVSGSKTYASLGTRTVQVCVKDDDNAQACDTLTISVVNPPEPELAAAKTHGLASDLDGDGVPSPGDELLYTIAITNSGGSAATQVVLTDNVPAHTGVVAGSVTATAGTVVAEDPVKVEIGEIGAGQTVTVSFRVAIDNPVPLGIREVSNQGTVTSAELPAVLTDDPELGGGSDPTVTMITAAPKLVAEKTDALVEEDGVASPGDVIEYRVAILNTGNTSATEVVFEDAIPPHTSLVPGSVVASTGTVESEEPVRVAIAEIAGGARVEVTFRVEIENPIATGVREVSNQGKVTSQELQELYTDDPEVGGPADPTVTPVTAAPVLRVEKTDHLHEDVDLDGAASPGDAVLYRITVSNDGNTAATGVVLTDQIPANATLVAGTVQTDQGTVESEEPVHAAIGEIAAGTTVTLSFQVRIDGAFPYTATELVNQAKVESGELEDVLSDDPETPEAADPTRTPVFMAPVVSIAGVTVEEDDGQAILTVTLSKAGDREVRVSWSTGAGTALAGADYTVSSGILIFAPGEISKTLAVPVLDDLIDELDEVFPVVLDGGEGVVTILDNDAPPQVSVADASVTEGDEGTVKAVFVVSLSGPSGLAVTLSYATADGTARAGLDYQAASGTVTIPAGATSATIEVDVEGDVIDENDETFAVVLSSPAFAVLARAEAAGNILDDDEALVSIGDAAVDEGNSGTVMLRMPVTLSTPAEREIRVDFTVAPGTATEGVDYDTVSGTVVFASGETSRFVDVPVRGDVLLESDETLFVDLAGSSIEDGIEDGRGVGTIRDDEVCPGPELLSEARDVDVSAYSEGQLFRFSGFVRTTSEDPADVARIVVEYRDASNTVVLDAFDTGEIASPAEWRPVFDEREAPAGTAFIRVTLTGDGAYFDGLSLVSLETATLTIGDVTLYEGNTGTVQALFPVRLSCAVGAGVATTYSTADGTALAGQDYLSTSGSLSLPAGTTEVTIPVTVLGDDVHELHETFRVLLGDASPKWVVRLDPAGVGTILDDDFCARSPGFWKTHPELWPVQALVIGGEEYDAAGMMALLSYEGPDASNHLARQLVATELNLLVGSTPSILPVVGQAHAFLEAHPPGSKPAGALREQANAVKDQLDAYNNPGCQEVPVIPGS